MIKKIVLCLAMTSSLIALNACSVLGVGKNDFSCPGKPHGVSCASTREMYEATNNGAVPAPVTEEEVEEMAKKKCHGAGIQYKRPYSQRPVREEQMSGKFHPVYLLP